MTSDDSTSGTGSAFDRRAMAHARRLLTAPEAPRERMWPALAAATLFAISALAFAVAMVMAPPVVTQHMPPGRSVGVG